MSRFIKSLALLFTVIFIVSCRPMAAATPTPVEVPPTATIAPTATMEPTPTITPTPAPTQTPTPRLLNIPAGPVTAPVLLYHHVTTAMEDSRYNVDPQKFEEQMHWLFENGYQTITVSQLVDLIYNGGQVPERPVVITIDDGNADIYSTAYPILQKYGFVATFYVVKSYINGEDMVTTDQLKELAQAGWEIGSHSKTHAHLPAPGVDLAEEIRMSKLDLEDMLGVKVNSFAYPFGEINDEVIRLTSAYGYTSGMGLTESVVHDLNSIFYLSRIEIQSDYDLQKFISLMPWSEALP